MNRMDLVERKLQRASAAGQRWSELSGRRADTVSRLRAGGTSAAESPERLESFRRREADKRLAFARAGLPDSAFTERRIGPTLDLDDDPPSEAARIAGMPVGRLVNLGDRGEILDGFATGFIIASNLLITNHHVFGSVNDCAGCGIQFGFEKFGGVLQQGLTFRLDPARFFHADEQLDYAIVGIEPAAIGGAALTTYRSLSLDPMAGKILVGQPISIIQYPDGGPKKYGVRDNELLLPPEPTDSFLQYTTDTLPGSSGSPAFNKDWEVVALHHSGVPEIKNGNIMTIRGEPFRRGMSDDEIHWVANEGARISKIFESVKALNVSAEHAAAYAELMKSFGQDFAKLPALISNPEAHAMDNTPLAGARAISITINGPGNFFLGAHSPIAPETPPQLDKAAIAVVPAATEKKIVFDPDYDGRPGYNEEFLGVKVPHPTVAPARMDEILKEGSAPHVLKYHHYSLVMNQRRRTVMWAAVNVDYTKKFRRKKRDEFGTDTWVPDPRILGKYQIMDQELYAPAAKFDRGHVVRRDDTAWGKTAKEEIFANSDSFHWTNCTPQHEAFNRDMYQYAGIGLWGMLENQIAKQAKNVGNKMSIFAGPMLLPGDLKHDFGGGSVRIPLKFWKVVLAAEDHDTNDPQLAAFGFVLDQTYAIEDYGIERTERFDPGEFETYQVSLKELAKESGVVFPKVVLDADALVGSPHEGTRIRLNAVEDVYMGRPAAV